MAYRGDDGGTALEAQTADGVLSLAVGPGHVSLSLGSRTLQLGDRFATLVDATRKKKPQRSSLELSGKLYIARGWPREDLGVWVELVGENAVRRIFGAAAPSTFTEEGIGAHARLDALAARLRGAVADLPGWSGRGTEIGAGHPLDKVLFAERDGVHVVYARGLFRDRAKFVMEVHPGGRIATADGSTVTVTSPLWITVWGDYLRFADNTGTDRARVSIPWLDAHDRRELARRIGQLVGTL